jgi:hypothetical protein
LTTFVPYVVQVGDFLAGIAHRVGSDPHTIWKAPCNTVLRKARGDGNILAPGDVIYVPERKPTWLALTAGATNRLVVKRPTVPVSLRIEVDGKPHGGASYRATCAGSEKAGTTDGDGGLLLQVPVDARSAVIEIDGVEDPIEVMIGHLDPVGTRTGLAHRLSNLGYLPLSDAAVAPSSEALVGAVARFQADRGLTPTGEADTETVKALCQEHGS